MSSIPGFYSSGSGSGTGSGTERVFSSNLKPLPPVIPLKSPTRPLNEKPMASLKHRSSPAPSERDSPTAKRPWSQSSSTGVVKHHRPVSTDTFYKSSSPGPLVKSISTSVSRLAASARPGSAGVRGKSSILRSTGQQSVYTKRKSAKEKEIVEQRKREACNKNKRVVTGSSFSSSATAASASKPVPFIDVSSDSDDDHSPLAPPSKPSSSRASGSRHIEKAQNSNHDSDEEESGPSEFLKSIRGVHEEDDFIKNLEAERTKLITITQATKSSRPTKKKTTPSASSTRFDDLDEFKYTSRKSASPPPDPDLEPISNPDSDPQPTVKSRKRKLNQHISEATPTTSKKSSKKSPKAQPKKDSSSSITSMLKTKDPKKKQSRRANISDDEEDDSDDELFASEGAATLAAKKKLEELKQAKRVDVLDIEENGTWSSSYKAGKKANSLQRILKAADNDEFGQVMQNVNVWIPDSQKSEDLLDVDIDLDVDLSTGFKNDYEEVDERANEIKKTRLVKKKYEGVDYNGSLTRRELEIRANQHLDCVPMILSGEQESAYYARCKEFMKGSRSTTFSTSDTTRDSFTQFLIGFYGLKRQSVIAQLISKKYRAKIQEAGATNKTIQFWSIDSFTLYVLSCEVAMRIACDDLGMEEDEVMELFQNTTDYGRYITDLAPLD